MSLTRKILGFFIINEGAHKVIKFYMHAKYIDYLISLVGIIEMYKLLNTLPFFPNNRRHMYIIYV